MEKVLLIVEDESELREVIAESLAGLADDILQAADGQEGLDLVKKHEITAILSDINMPRKNGLELLRDIRFMGYDIPFVILSAYGDKEKVVEALRLGAFDFLNKPFNESVLTRVMEKALKHGEKLREFEEHFQRLAQNSDLSVEDLALIKEAKRQLWLMRQK